MDWLIKVGQMIQQVVVLGAHALNSLDTRLVLGGSEPCLRATSSDKTSADGGNMGPLHISYAISGRCE